MRRLAVASVLLAACVGAPDRIYYDDDSGADGGPNGDPNAKYTIGGVVTSLKGTGLVLTNDGADDLAIAADGPFTFARKAKAGDPYDVAIKTQPANPAQACQIAGGKGTVKDGSVSNVYVACGTDKFGVGGAVTGLKTGQSVVIEDNGGDDLTLDKDGAFAFPTTILSGLPYEVTIKTQPSQETCEVAKGKGVMGSAAVTDVTIACGDKLYAVGGTAVGVAAAGLSVKDDVGGETVAVDTSGAFAFPTKHVDGTPYAVSLVGTAAGEVCSVANASGNVMNADVTSIAVTCEYRENFDGSASLPVGWSADSDWAIATTGNLGSDSAPNHMFTSDGSQQSDKSLTSKPYAIVAADAVLTFHHQYATETNWDGAVLEIAIPGVASGNFQDIVAAGGAFKSGGYNGSISIGFNNVLDGRQAWTGSSGAYVTTVASLPAAAAGKTVTIRFRFGSGKATPATGWAVDTIALRP